MPTESYQPDVLNNGFEKLTFHFPNDYEGEVTCTLIRKRNNTKTTKAVLYIHGFNDYFFQEEMADEYLKRDYHFYALDLRKYGRSLLVHQKMNNVRDLKEYDADIDRCLLQIRKEGCLYTLLNGHSAGGLIVTYYAKRKKESDLFNTLFLNSPFFDFNEKKIFKIIASFVAKLGIYFPNIPFPGKFTKWYGMSIHKSFYGEWNYLLDWKPYIAPMVNLGWIHAINKAQNEVKKGLEITKPLLILHSEESLLMHGWEDNIFYKDVILNIDDIVRESKKIKGNVTIIAIKGAVHDIMLSKKEIRNLVYSTLFQWKYI